VKSTFTWSFFSSAIRVLSFMTGWLFIGYEHAKNQLSNCVFILYTFIEFCQAIAKYICSHVETQNEYYVFAKVNHGY
jgi:hypothetical protein